MFASLSKQLETQGRITIRGGQCEGRVEASNDLYTENQYVPSVGKGAEYAVKYKAEEDRAYYEAMKNPPSQVVNRLDVTGNGSSQMEQLEELTSIGTLPNVRDLCREELTQVYTRYKFDPVEPSDHLESIFSLKEEIVNIIESNSVCIIQGPTGCGKSTQIPQFILDNYASKMKHCNIVVTQPRRIAAITLAQRVCKERGWGEPGGIVGYQVGLDKTVEEDTRILYCTTGVLLEKLISKKHMNDYTHILLDEVHERDEDMDFLMLIVRKFRRTVSPNVKVVLMSATIDISRLAEYFEVMISVPRGGMRKERAPSIEIKTEGKYSVQVHYINDLEGLGPIPDSFKDEEPGITNEAYMLVPIMIRAFRRIDDEDYRCRRSNEKRGAVLIFLPGLHQIETLHKILIEEDEKQRRDPHNPDMLNLWLCPLHSSITRDEQEKVVSYPPPNMRKVILSTNIAESSLTIPDVKYVIDFCLTKHLVADNNTGFTSLRLAWASHVNCIQREGRVGRVQDGRVYRMVPKTFFQFKMPKESVPEILRCPLDIIVLKCKRLMEDECPLKLISNALDPPELDNYEKTILKLKQIGGLLKTCRGVDTPEDGDLTFMGRVMGSLPLDIRITKLILLGHVFDVLEEAIIMGSAMAVKNLFSEPFQRRLEAYNNKLLWADSSECDAVAYLNAYLVWRSLTALGKFQRSKYSETSWGKSYMLQIKHLRELSLQEEEIKKRLRNFNIRVRYKPQPSWNAKEKPLILKLVLAGAFYPNYYSCSAQNQNAEIEAVKMLGGHSPYQCVYLQNMPQPAPLYFDQVKDFLQNNNVSEHLELYHDSSQKLIVKFNPTKMFQKKVGDRDLNAEIPGDIVMPVYRAIKMRQLDIPLTVRVFPQSIAREKLNSLVLNSRSSMMSLREHLSEYKPAIPWDQQIIEISISHVENAGHFFGHINPSTQEKLRRIYYLLNSSDLLCRLAGEVEEGAIYAAPFKDEGDPVPSYYRAKVTKHHEKDFVDVFFIDYGNSINYTPVDELREVVNEDVQAELDHTPPLAVECVLAEVAPAHWNAKGGHWSKEATNYVKLKLNSPQAKNTWATQVYSYVNGVASVHLYLEEEARDGMLPLTLNEDLIKKGYARFREESYLSKKNHAKRKEIASGDSPRDSVEDSNIFKSMSKDLMMLPISKGTKNLLKGPYSPLEMKLFSKIKSSCQKDVRVEWNSVNSVLLDSDPTDPHEKLLVAGFVSQTQDGRRLCLNHTTVLPPINGLAALVSLTFAPAVELRCDDFRSRYTGALCGLGCNASGRPLFPENDMEIKFDVELKDEDLLNVNKLRYFLNERFCGEESEEMPDQRIVFIQKSIRQLILSLFKTKPRQPVKVAHCPTPHKWGLVSEDYLVPTLFTETSEYGPPRSIYELLYAIDLKPENDLTYIQDLVKKVNILMSFVQKDLPPREMVCELCDIDFSYWTQLREHVASHHHKELAKWLKKRAEAHGLSLDLSMRLPPPAPASASTSQQPRVRPSTSRQPTNKPNQYQLKGY